MAVHTVEDRTSFAFVPSTGAKKSAPITLKYGDDYVTKDETGQTSADIDAPIVFVGYGIDAPEYQWNDFAGVDVKGKVVLAIVNEPPSNDLSFFKGPALTYYGRWTYKYEEAERRGAVGVMVVHQTQMASYGGKSCEIPSRTEKSYLVGDPMATLRAASWIQLEVANQLFAAAGLDGRQMIEAAGKRGFKAIELPVRLHAHITSTIRRYTSQNVIAMMYFQARIPPLATVSSTRRTTITWASIRRSPAIRSTTERRTMRPAAQFCSRLPGPTRQRPCGRRITSTLRR